MASTLAPKLARRLYTAPQQVSDPRIIDEIARFRAAAWTKEDGLADDAFPDGQWTDRYDATATHWVIRDASGTLVGSARLSVHPRLQDVDEWEYYERLGLAVGGPIAAPARVVIHPTARGFGLAAQLLDAQDEAARSAGATCALRQASPRMANLLVSRGWRILGRGSPDPRFPSVQFQVACLPLSPDWRL